VNDPDNSIIHVQWSYFPILFVKLKKLAIIQVGSKIRLERRDSRGTEATNFLIL
jgi:hypothetical protein